MKNFFLYFEFKKISDLGMHPALPFLVITVSNPNKFVTTSKIPQAGEIFEVEMGIIFFYIHIELLVNQSQFTCLLTTKSMNESIYP